MDPKEKTLKEMSDMEKEKISEKFRETLHETIKEHYEKAVKKEVESVPYNIWVYFVSGHVTCFEEARFFLPYGAMDDMVYIREKNGATTYLMMQNVERLTYMEVEKND